MAPLRNSLDAIFTLTTAGTPSRSVARNAASNAGASPAVVSTYAPKQPRASATFSYGVYARPVATARSSP